MMKTITTFLLTLYLVMSGKNDKTTASVKREISKSWWKEDILYQIYSQSFKDYDGNRFGEFKGVILSLN
ncbi:hypothetical protein ACFO5O_08985 [Geojedonia litorea]|uniref:Uncharacterized protein n=1 Tax=Geojedonia litorea TaxID=1268269 RepID=A0ABV9N4U2_9FLAO